MAGSAKQRPQTAGDQSAEVCCRECGRHLKMGSLRSHFERVHDEQAEFIRFCEECGGRFEHQNPEKIYCSDKCHLESKRVEKETSVCEGCGDEIKHYPSVNQNYCSKSCAHSGVSDASPSEREESHSAEDTEVYDILDGIGGRKGKAEMLVEAGYETEQDLREADPNHLLEISGIGRNTVSQICRTLNEPWPTPFEYGPGSKEEATEPTPTEPDEHEEPGEQEKEEQTKDEEADGQEQQGLPEEVLENDDLIQCPYCRDAVERDGFTDHVKDCEEA